MRVQKAAMRIILGKKYTEYENALEKVDLEKLSERRKMLCLKLLKRYLQIKWEESSNENKISEHFEYYKQQQFLTCKDF